MRNSELDFHFWGMVKLLAFIGIFILSVYIVASDIQWFGVFFEDRE